jgi:hypothetical protein
MKRSRVAIAIALISVLGIFFLYSLLATGKDTTKSEQAKGKEVYVSEVVLQAPWAEKNLVYDGEESSPGEFGLETFVFSDDSLREELPDPPLPEGPTSFTVAPNEDIYITDPLNYRIQRFSQDGEFISVIPRIEVNRYEWSFICVDHNNNIYFLRWEDNVRQTICKYDQTGNLLTTSSFFEDYRVIDEIDCDSLGRLFCVYTRMFMDKRPLTPPRRFTFQFGTTVELFTPEEQKLTLRRGTIKIHDLSKVAVPTWKPPAEGFGLDYMRNTMLVDEKGNFYRYWSTKEGIIVTRWHKQ